MSYVKDSLPKRTTGLPVLSGLLIALVGLTVLGTFYLTHRNYDRVALAARPGLDGPDIDLLDRQNKAYERVIQATTPAIVYVRTEQVIRAEQSPLFMDPMFRQFFGPALPQIPRDQKQHALGTGVVFDRNGYIVTNNHVIDHANTVDVMTTDKRMFKAKVVGTDPDIDIAVLKIDVSNVPTIVLGDSSTLHVGDTVMAFGNPFGLNFTVTRGTVSALGRSQLNIEPVQDFIQTDAAINPGNSGGALVDVHGEMIGINTAILSPGGGGEAGGGFIGIGFAIPVDTVRRITGDLITLGYVRHPWLGVQSIALQDFPGLSRALRLESDRGLMIVTVLPNSPTAQGGIRGATQEVIVGNYRVPAGGDVLLALQGKELRSRDDLPTEVDRYKPGDKVTVTVLRGNRKIDLPIVLQEAPRQ